MPRLGNFVVVSFAMAVMLGGSLSVATARQMHGDDVARVLAGRAIDIECVDGTHGRGQVSEAGLVSGRYRRAGRASEQIDQASVRVQGSRICLAWKQFSSGSGCYPVFERALNRFRLGSGPLWCDISAK